MSDPFTYNPLALHPSEQKRLEMERKLQARLMLTSRKGIITPSQEEWIGLMLLERDDELPNRKGN